MGIMKKPDALLRGFGAGLMLALPPKSIIFVVDGDCLLHQVGWVESSSFFLHPGTPCNVCSNTFWEHCKPVCQAGNK
jgi:hypothetical protein